MKIRLSVFTLIFCSFLIAQGSAQDKVKVWEEPLTIPTYLVKAPDKNPMFFQHQSYQGASRVIYPYALQDNITDEKADKMYQALYLENEYIKLCVLPEIGGRLFYAIDKTNGYDIFYHQHVIKPANIGMAGAWISGGIEFCVFHHHRASTNLPVDYSLKQNDDGSATIWIGETEPRQRMKWTIGISLFPGKSYIQVDGRLMNPTDNVNSMLYWANVATQVNDNYQVIFPPSTDFAVYHAKNSFAHWPVTHETYNGKEYYRNNIDASWWKNHPDPVSFFAHDIKEGFLAGYDYGKHAGTMHVANQNIVKGAKLWEWGPGDYGAMWDSKVLTDSDGPYAELMAGAYSDNQPDYSWIKPYEYKTFRQNWYPLRETEGAVAANLNATINLKKTKGNEYIVAANTTQKFPGSKILLQKNDQTIFVSVTDISPANPFSQKVKVENAKEEELKISLIDENGNELISYKPVKKEENLPLPQPVEPPKPPQEIQSVEELYLTGLRIKQFHNARLEPEAYFEEALKRDSLDTRCNTMMGIVRQQDFKLDEAAGYFRTALKRLTANYTRPKNCEPFFHLGVILKQQKKYDAAYDTLYRAAWDQDFASAAYFHLAQISSIRKNYEQALEEINRSLDYNAANLTALNLKISLLRITGKKEGAKMLADLAVQRDALNFRAINENVLLGTTDWETLKKQLRNNPESYLELAVDYLNSGLNDEAKTLLSQAINGGNKQLRQYPTIHYYLASIYNSEGNLTKAEAYLKIAQNLPTDYCFPYRFETIDVYKTAIQLNPGGSRAYYYLGNLLYDKQPEEAIRRWVKASQYEPGLAVAERNIGWGYNQTYGNLKNAITAYEKAIQQDKTQPRFYYELDKLYEKNGTGIDIRRELLTENHEIVSQRPDAFLQEIQVLSLSGDYKKAIEYLTNHFFPRQEGVDNLHEIYVDACLGQGLTEFKAANYEAALHYFQMADEYPENHQIGRNDNYEKNAQIYYCQAVTYERLKNRKTANQLYEKINKTEVRSPEFEFYKALALQKTGKTEVVKKLEKEIEQRGKQLITEAGEDDFFSKFGDKELPNLRQSNGNYLLGLANLLKGNDERAYNQFESAVQINPGHLWSHIFLMQMNN